MGRKKKGKIKKKLRTKKDTGATGKNNTAGPAQPEQPDLSHLSGDWREFYRLVIEQIN